MTFQEHLVRILASATGVGNVMNTSWAWPVAESLHFIGLSVLTGTIGMFDLRVLGMASRVPIAVFQRLLPWGLLGFAFTTLSGAAFLMTEPDQYVFNSAFHFKLLFMALAGLNALTFTVIAGRNAAALTGEQSPVSAKIMALASLILWIAVLVCGRLLTFYRPGDCAAGGPGLLANCF